METIRSYGIYTARIIMESECSQEMNDVNGMQHHMLSRSLSMQHGQEMNNVNGTQHHTQSRSLNMQCNQGMNATLIC